MCVLCGEMMSSLHWSERVMGESKEVIVGENQRSWRVSRLKKAQISNMVLRFYGLSLAEWQGSKFILNDKKGKSLVISHLGELWEGASKLCGKAIDPLDTNLLEFLKHNG